MDKTVPVDWLEKSFEGYVMNSLFSEKNTSSVMSIIDAITSRYGDSVYCMPRESLHITLLDWIAPLVDYDGRDKEELFNNIYGTYNRALDEIITNESKFEVTFDAIHVAPTTIYITGQDNGEFERIRNKFLDAVELLANTKRPPTIIHSSLARFTKELDLHEVEAFIATQSISINQTVENFRLVHTHKEPMLEFEVLKTYQIR